MKGTVEKPYLITPLAAFDPFRQEIELREAARLKPDCVEWRVDLFKEIMDESQFRIIVKRIRSYLAPETELLVTLKGGSIRFASFAASLPEVDYVDIDLYEYMSLDLHFQLSSKFILSYHNMRETPDLHSLENIMEEGLSVGGTIKIATQCNSDEDARRLLSLPLPFSHARLICVPMGILGSPYRVVAHKYGSAASYATLITSTAVGQISFCEMKHLQGMPEFQNL